MRQGRDGSTVDDEGSQSGVMAMAVSVFRMGQGLLRTGAALLAWGDRGAREETSRAWVNDPISGLAGFLVREPRLGRRFKAIVRQLPRGGIAERLTSWDVF